MQYILWNSPTAGLHLGFWKFPFSNKKGTISGQFVHIIFHIVCKGEFYVINVPFLFIKMRCIFKLKVHFHNPTNTHPPLFSLRCNPATALKSINSKAVPKQTTHSFKFISCTHIFQQVSQNFKKNLLLSIHD